jgi:hypothetical protein
MSLIALEVYRHLFTSVEAMEAFANALETATKEDNTPLVTFRTKHIATAISPRATEKLLSDRILQRFVEKPELLDTFVGRLRDLKPDDIVD